MWICLFTCCATRAVHLDLVVDMTATSFILCFRRFRGIPLKLISENSKTFKSANKIIVGMLSHPDVEKFFRIEWSFNVEKAGRIFERLIGSTMRCLKKVI